MTKADFYIGNGIAANWIGSIREDGYPRGISLEILICTNPTLYEELVVDFIHGSLMGLILGILIGLVTLNIIL